MQKNNAYLRIASCGSALGALMGSASLTIVFLAVASRPSQSAGDKQLFQSFFTQFSWAMVLVAASTTLFTMMFLMLIARRRPMSEREAVLARKSNRLFALSSPLFVFTVGITLWGFVRSLRILCDHGGALTDSPSFSEVGIQLGALAMWTSMMSVQFYQRGRLRADSTPATAMPDVEWQAPNSLT
ncbi:MAG: hypothetical protein H7210_07535 [Pyrinomonadaceae bacterium]|nr:hypothetical protein [Phycisphaerales bacterium]